MILAWILLFSLLTIHADNYKTTPPKIWIQAAQQRKSNQDSLYENTKIKQTTQSFKLLDPKNSVPSKGFEHTFPGHNAAVTEFQKESTPSIENSYDKPKPQTKKVSKLTMLKPHKERANKHSVRRQIKLNTKGTYPNYVW